MLHNFSMPISNPEVEARGKTDGIIGYKKRRVSLKQGWAGVLQRIKSSGSNDDKGRSCAWERHRDSSRGRVGTNGDAGPYGPPSHDRERLRVNDSGTGDGLNGAGCTTGDDEGNFPSVSRMGSGRAMIPIGTRHIQIRTTGQSHEPSQDFLAPFSSISSELDAARQWLISAANFLELSRLG